MENQSLNFDNYLFRCSSLGKLLTEPQSKVDKQSGNLSKSTENYLKELHKEILFKRKKYLKNKYLEKGIIQEEKSLSLYSTIESKPFFKNKEFFKNEFICGTPDNCKGIIRDIKTSWDYSTFPFYDEKIENKDYIAQLNGYMELTGQEEAELIYCLVDTPTRIINDELRRADWKMLLFDNNGNAYEEKIDLIVEMVSNMIYTEKGLLDFCNESELVRLEWFDNFREVPEWLRIKVFKIKKDQELINSIYSKIEKSRTYLNNLSLKIANLMPVEI